MLQIKHFVYNAFMENTYVLYDETKNCVIIDPGCYEQQEKNTLSTFIQKQGLTVVQLLNTHCHIDHVLGNQYIKTTYQTKLALHHLEEPILQATAIYAPQYGITNYELSQPDTLLKEGDQIKFGPVILDVLHVPGHSPGHIAFYDKKNKACFSGDVLFQGNIGRTDLPGGHRDTLLQTIRQKIFSLDDEVVIYPGHGAQTTVGEEQRNNPFCKCSA